MKKVMITGCRGQVGRCLVEELEGKVELLALDSSQLDITDSDKINASVEAFVPDYIINTAAYTAVELAENNPEQAYAVNSDGPNNLALAAERYGSVLIHLSTDYVFNGKQDGEKCESDTVDPLNIYGASKLKGERAVMDACTKHIILRTSWVFSQQENNFVSAMLNLRSQLNISVVSDQIGGPTYVGCIAKTLVQIIKGIDAGLMVEWGIYHYSGRPNVSWFEFAQSIFAQAKHARWIDSIPCLHPVSSAHYLTNVERPKNTCLANYKIYQVFGVKSCNWELGLKSIFNKR